jgi:protein-S-isoprenylcysteine O-methyltransferase Ste14
MSSFESGVAAAAGLAPRLESLVYRGRNLLAGLPLVLAWAAAPPPRTAAAFVAACGLVAGGVALRAWATLHNRYAQGGGRKTLATGGPYSWLRNPLYVANSLVMLGGLTALGAWAWLAEAVLWFVLVYQVTVLHEERRLGEKYGAAYHDYCARVGRWWPTARGEWPRGGLRPFLSALLVQSTRFAILLPALLRPAL